MTKADILKMKTGREIIKAMFAYPDLVDKEVSEYQKSVSQKEYIKEHGSLDVIFDPFKKK